MFQFSSCGFLQLLTQLSGPAGAILGRTCRCRSWSRSCRCQRNSCGASNGKRPRSWCRDPRAAWAVLRDFFIFFPVFWDDFKTLGWWFEDDIWILPSVFSSFFGWWFEQNSMNKNTWENMGKHNGQFFGVFLDRNPICGIPIFTTVTSDVSYCFIPILTLFWTGVFLRSFCIQDEEGGEGMMGMRCSDGALRHYKPRGLAWQFMKNHMGLQMGDQPTIMINQAIVFGKWRSSTGFRGTSSNCLFGQTHMTCACPWITCNWVQCQFRYLGQKPTQLSQQAVDTSVRHGAFASALLRLRDAMSSDAHSFELPPQKMWKHSGVTELPQKQVNWQDSWFLSSSFFHFYPCLYISLQSQKSAASWPCHGRGAHQAIVLAALGKGEVILKGALWSEDTEAMVECMKRALLARLARDVCLPQTSNNIGYFNGISYIYITTYIYKCVRVFLIWWSW